MEKAGRRQSYAVCILSWCFYYNITLCIILFFAVNSSRYASLKSDFKKTLQKNKKFEKRYCFFVYLMIYFRLRNIGAIAPYHMKERIYKMKQGIHPDYKTTTIQCACGAEYVTKSVKDNVKVDICSKCHPFFTGKQKFVDAGGRVDKFKKKFNLD